MKKTISKEQYDELQLLSCIDDEAYHSKLGEIGVDARPYRAYQYFDEYGNYKGDSDDMTVDDLLDAMDISVEEKPINCGECTYCKKNSFSLDHRTKNWHECCILARKEIGVATRDLSTAMPDWCPLNKGNDIKPTEDYQHSENKPQEKCQFPPEMPDFIAGVPVSDLLFIAQIVGDNPRLIEQIKDGYAFGHAVGYKAGLELFEKKVHEAISKIAAEPIRLEQGDGFDFTKVKFEIPPYKQQDEVINMARLYGVPVYTPKVINVVNPSTDGDDKK